MPKRIPTPPPPNDEPKYLTIVRPYPLNANWELSTDIKEFARWIACCVGTEPFRAIFYKPRARNMVILEIERSFQRFDALLGEHRWNEFLKKPTDEEKDCVSQIFYCLYTSDREAQKDGWKRIDVKNEWFTNWSLINSIIVHPYPKTYWCDIPPEDVTNKRFCRPLPRQSAPSPPPKPAPLVVGSSVWVNARTTETLFSLSDTQPAHRTRSRGAPSTLTIPTWGVKSVTSSRKSPAGSVVKSPSTPSSASNKGSSSSGSSTTPASQGWTPRTDGSSPASSIPAQSASPPIVSAQSAPISKQPTSWADQDVTDNSWWNEPPLIPVETSPTPAPDTNAMQGGLAESKDLAAHRNVAIDPDLVQAIENMAIDNTLDPDMSYITGWEKDHIDNNFLDGVDVSGVTSAKTVEVCDSLWDDEPVAHPVPTQDLCTAHGVICKKGICQEYSKQLREAKRLQARQEWEATQAEKKRRKKGKGDGSSVCSSPWSARSVAGSSNKHSIDDSSSSVSSWRRDDRAPGRAEAKSPIDGDGRWTTTGGKGRYHSLTVSLASNQTDSVAGGSDKSGPSPRPW